LITLIAGTRPNFMKIAPIRRALDARKLEVRLIHTGQHFDEQMSDVFFRDLGIPAPDLALHSGGGSHAEQTAAVLVGVEKDLIAHRPDALLVVGDVTSTLASALAASKLQIPIIHAEAGLRSRDWTMPEEVNRILTDQLSDLLLIPSRDAVANLLAEGIPEERIVFVGNVMIDSLHRSRQTETDALARFAVEKRHFALVTLHRPANVDTKEALVGMLIALEAIAKRLPVLFPVHPRTTARIEQLGEKARLEAITNLRPVPPLGYNDFVTLMAHAAVIATDSGGIQEESTALGIPCLTMREGTERPITVTEGTNIIVGHDAAKISHELDEILAGRGKGGRIPEGWDGRTADRIADAIARFLAGTPKPKAQGPRA
jgi:UDP-N-acetylglucosamine 2-epimerase (non-hydrolysing)